jgi:Domain of unknown function (DUF4383)
MATQQSGRAARQSGRRWAPVQIAALDVSILHNIVHLAIGVAGLALARTFGGARGFLLGSGAIYLVLTLFGLVIDHDSPANFVPVNAADNWLHLVLAVGMLVLGVVLGRSRTTA